VVPPLNSEQIHARGNHAVHGQQRHALAERRLAERRPLAGCAWKGSSSSWLASRRLMMPAITVNMEGVTAQAESSANAADDHACRRGPLPIQLCLPCGAERLFVRHE
jgi:hypothetical protein